MKYVYMFLIDFVIFFTIFYLFYSFYLKKRKKDYNKLKKSDYVKAFIARYNLDVKKTSYNAVLNTLAFNNAFTIAFTSALILNIKSYFWKVAVSFVVLFILLFSLYEVGGRYLKKKEDKKNV